MLPRRASQTGKLAAARAVQEMAEEGLGMGTDAIAYGPDEEHLLTFDGEDLLAYDARTEAPRWQLALGRAAAAVLFVDPQVVPGRGTNPWRAQSVARAAVVVSTQGHLQLVDTTLGQTVGELGPFGEPTAATASLPGASLALAVDGKVLVWRSGVQHELLVPRARALAFSGDGATLAVGSDRGELRMFDLGSEKPEQTFRAEVRSAVLDLAQHPDGSWVAATEQGVFVVTALGTMRRDRLPPARRLRFDGNGGRLAMQVSERGIVVYEWPKLAVLMRVEYTDRPVRGLAFGPESWLGVALDHGDGNKIDVVTSDVNRTDTHPGRQHRSWTLLVEGRKERLSAKEAEDVRRMKDPFHVSAPAPTNRLGARIGIGAMISIALLSVRVCVRASNHSSSSWNHNPTLLNAPTLANHRCDRACAAERLRRVQVACAGATADCSADADAAAKALANGKCAEAKQALARVSSAIRTHDRQATGRGSGSTFMADVLLATLGLQDACAGGAILPRVVEHAELVRLQGPDLEPSYERIPETDPAEGSVPRAVWAASDGTVYVATTLPADALDDTCVVYRSTRPRSWERVYSRAPCSRPEIFGRSSNDVYVMTDKALAHFDGKGWKPVATPALAMLTAATSVGPDVFLAGADESRLLVHRRRGTSWVNETLPEEVSPTTFFGGTSTTLWAVGDGRGGEVLLHRSASGSWAIKTPPGDAETMTIDSVWVSPTGEVFVATGAGVVHRSKNGGATWTTDEPPSTIHELWGRTSNDVYGRSSSGLLHYDGKTWSTTSYDGQSEAFTGTERELLVVRATGATSDGR